MVNQSVQDRANASAAKAKQFSPGVQYAITCCLGNIMNGAFWGFTDMSGVKEHIEAIREAAPNIVARQLGNACLIEVAPQYILGAVQAIDPQALSQQDIQNITMAQAEAHMAFEKFLLAKGKKSCKEGQAFSGTVGIYCTNDVTTIAYKGINYPAFRLGIQDVLSYLNTYGYTVQVGSSFVSPSEAMNAGATLWGSMHLSPTKTGVFLNIRCNGNAALYQNLEQNLKIRQGKGQKK